MDKSRINYYNLYQEYEVLMNLSISISENTFNKGCKKNVEVASWLYTKVITHIFSIYKLLPRSPFDNNSKNEIWDISSIAVLTRTIIDTYYVLYYIGVDEIEESLFDFRLLVFQYHSEHKRLQKIKLMNLDKNKYQNIELEFSKLKEELIKNEYFNKFDNELKRQIKKGKKAILLTNTEMSDLCGVSKDYYNLIFKDLSSYVHSYPFAINKLSSFRAGNNVSLDELGLIVEYSLVYLSLSIRDFISIIPDDIDIKLSKKEMSLIEDRCFLAKKIY